MEQFNNRKGFTLIELLVTIALLGILAGGILMVLNIPELLTKTNITKAKKFSAQIENSLVISQVGKWSFESDAKDISGYANNGSLNSATIETAANCDLGLGQCLKVSGGVNQYVSVPDSPSLRISSYTVSVWIKPNGVPNEEWKGIVGKGQAFPARNYNIWLHQSGSIHHRFATTGNGNDGIPNTPPGVIKWNEWNHVVITNNGTTAKTYVNGKQEASGSVSGTLVVYNASLCIGRNLDNNCGGDNYFNGLIDEVQIYSQALTLSQIQHLYAQGVIRRVLAYR